ncbi:hypothetical protein GMLC_25100 [Geomonas limicola]|uniref:Uncharacterized protein n=1 Tax=Geomonas limicola TaxID=2740186 RepID=A0A6V8N8U3_9BACT|nr:hypothetical protein [Geomonas limicola]GFO68931.1 hypothetical protein GMLC_25100 [Geomonas limicola]
MTRIAVILSTSLFLLAGTAAHAQTQSEKDECLLASRNCIDQVDDIYRRMHRLDKEIRKGTRVYSPQELKKLQIKLTETQEELKTLERPGK